MDSVCAMLLRCADNPSVDTALLMAPYHAGCVVRCASHCLRIIETNSSANPDICCSECRDDCMGSDGASMSEGTASTWLSFSDPIHGDIAGLLIICTVLACLYVLLHGGRTSFLQHSWRKLAGSASHQE